MSGYLLKCLRPIEMLAAGHKPDFILTEVDHVLLLVRHSGWYSSQSPDAGRCLISLAPLLESKAPSIAGRCKYGFRARQRCAIRKSHAFQVRGASQAGDSGLL